MKTAVSDSQYNLEIKHFTPPTSLNT